MEVVGWHQCQCCKDAKVAYWATPHSPVVWASSYILYGNALSQPWQILVKVFKSITNTLKSCWKCWCSPHTPQPLQKPGYCPFWWRLSLCFVIDTFPLFAVVVFGSGPAAVWRNVTTPLVKTPPLLRTQNFITGTRPSNLSLPSCND